MINQEKTKRYPLFLLAAVLCMSMTCAVYTFGAEKAPSAGNASPLININHASVEQLTQLPRIGNVIAQRIVDYRDKNGPFQSVDEIMAVQGIGEKVFEQIRPYITVTEETGCDLMNMFK